MKSYDPRNPGNVPEYNGINKPPVRPGWLTIPNPMAKG